MTLHVFMTRFGEDICINCQQRVKFTQECPGRPPKPAYLPPAQNPQPAENNYCNHCEKRSYASEDRPKCVHCRKVVAAERQHKSTLKFPVPVNERLGSLRFAFKDNSGEVDDFDLDGTAHDCIEEAGGRYEVPHVIFSAEELIEHDKMVARVAWRANWGNHWTQEGYTEDMIEAVFVEWWHRQNQISTKPRQS